MSLLQRLFRRDVNGVIADLQRKVDLLAAISVEQRADAQIYCEEAAELYRKAAAAVDEANRAASIRSKIQALIS